MSAAPLLAPLDQSIAAVQRLAAEGLRTTRGGSAAGELPLLARLGGIARAAGGPQ